jgi:hypothetical protein
MTRLVTSVVVLGALAAAPGALAQVAATTALTYQGQLKSGGAPANGTYDFLFRMFSAATGGTQMGSTICADNVQVTDGLVTVTLNFGGGFDGNARWLQVQVRADTTAGNCDLGTFTTLSPRQAMTATPYASGVVLPLEEVTDYFGSGLWISNSGGTALEGDGSGTNQAGVLGYNTDPNGTTYGVRGESSSTLGVGVYGHAAAGTQSMGVLGESVQGYGGFFIGKGYFSDFLGLGTTTPVVPLQVVGGSDLTLGGGGNIVVGQIGSANLVMDSNEIQARNSGGTASLFINANGGNVGIGTNNAQGFQLAVNGPAAKPNGGSWSTLSDERVKRNIQPLSGALDKLLRLRGVTFEYIDPVSINELPGVHTGMVAQEVEKVAPEWITTGPTGLKSIAFSGFEALAVEALRELRDRTGVAEQADRSRIAALEQENRDLHRELEDLRTAVRALGTQRGSTAQPLSSAR